MNRLIGLLVVAILFLFGMALYEFAVHDSVGNAAVFSLIGAAVLKLIISKNDKPIQGGDECDSKLEELKEGCEKMKTECDETEKEQSEYIAELEADAKKHEEALKAKERENNIKADKIEKLEQAAQEKSGEDARLIVKKSDGIDKLLAQLKELKEEKVQLETSKEKLDSEIRIKEDELDTCNKEHENLTEANAMLETELEEKDSELKDTYDKLKRTNEELEEKNKELSKKSRPRRKAVWDIFA